MLSQCRECTNMTVQIYRHIGVTYMDVAFPYKEAITNAYDLIIVTRSNIAWKLYGLIDHTTTHVASRVSSYVLEEKAKG